MHVHVKRSRDTAFQQSIGAPCGQSKRLRGHVAKGEQVTGGGFPVTFSLRRYFYPSLHSPPNPPSPPGHCKVESFSSDPGHPVLWAKIGLMNKPSGVYLSYVTTAHMNSFQVRRINNCCGIHGRSFLRDLVGEGDLGSGEVTNGCSV